MSQRLVETVQALKVGDGREQGTTQVPLIDQDAVAKVQAHIQDAKAKGATVQTGGTLAPQGATFFLPTVLTGVTQDMRVLRKKPLVPSLHYSVLKLNKKPSR